MALGVDLISDFKYTIYPDGFVLYSLYLTDSISNYEGWITEEEYIELLDLIWNYNFFNYKNYYFGPDDSIFFDPTYYTMVNISSQATYKFFAGLTAPVVAEELWDAIFDKVKNLDYVPYDPNKPFKESGWLGLSWRTWAGLFGGTAAVGVLSVVGYIVRRARR